MSSTFATVQGARAWRRSPVKNRSTVGLRQQRDETQSSGSGPKALLSIHAHAADTIEAMKRAFAAYSSGVATVPQKNRPGDPPDDGVLLIKPALLPNEAVGAKLISTFPGNTAKGRPVISGLVILFNEKTGEPMGLRDGGFLTAWRTGAASGAATDCSPVPTQPWGPSSAAESRAGPRLSPSTPSDRSRRSGSSIQLGAARRLCRRDDAAVSAGCPVVSVHQAVAGADVICTATTATEPVILGRDLSDGADLNGVGSFTPAMREVDGAAIARAQIVVDSREAATKEAGEPIRAVADGLTRAEDWAELGEIVSGARPGRESDSQLTFFKSVGLAVQDMAAAALAFDRAAELSLGTEIDLS